MHQEHIFNFTANAYETIEDANANNNATTEKPIVECHDSFDTACNYVTLSSASDCYAHYWPD